MWIGRRHKTFIFVLLFVEFIFDSVVEGVFLSIVQRRYLFEIYALHSNVNLAEINTQRRGGRENSFPNDLHIPAQLIRATFYWSELPGFFLLLHFLFLFSFNLFVGHGNGGVCGWVSQTVGGRRHKFNDQYKLHTSHCMSCRSNYCWWCRN